MGYFKIYVLSVLLIIACQGKDKRVHFTDVEIEEIFKDSLSIRAIELTGDRLFFACNKGAYGFVDLGSDEVTKHEVQYEDSYPEFRAVGHTSDALLMLSVANPALLYKVREFGEPELVYVEKDSMVFYDAMNFWNENEGIAMGDFMDGCLAIIITRDGGQTWNKLPCSVLPEPMEGEGAYAASNTNISVINDHTWIATSSMRIFYSPDKGVNWEVIQTPVINGASAQGIYSIDFYDDKIGFAIGGDYTSPEYNAANKAITLDGGHSWHLIAENQEPNYKSCVQFVPSSSGKGLVAVGFTGISYSADQGLSWKKLSDEPLYTLRFLNDSLAYGAGQRRIVKLKFLQ